MPNNVCPWSSPIKQSAVQHNVLNTIATLLCQRGRVENEATRLKCIPIVTSERREPAEFLHLGPCETHGSGGRLFKVNTAYVYFPLGSEKLACRSWSVQDTKMVDRGNVLMRRVGGAISSEIHRQLFLSCLRPLAKFPQLHHSFGLLELGHFH